MLADKTVSFISTYCEQFGCGYIVFDLSKDISCTACDEKIDSVHFLCEMKSNAEEDTGAFFQMPPLRNKSYAFPTVKCPAGHLVHVFSVCDEQSECWSHRYSYRESESDVRGVPSRTSCPVSSVTSLPAMFACSSGWQRVPYSLVCDHRPQCADGSDENFCVFPPCSGSAILKCASSAQCVSLSAVCDHRGDCPQDTDESRCIFLGNKSGKSPPAIVYFAGNSSSKSHSFGVFELDSACPETHFQCLNNGYCLPVFVLCNGVSDCSSHEDEARCESSSCPGYYRCRSSRICLHPDHVCDGQYQCPEHDDELVCHLICPAECTCLGLDFRCHHLSFQAELYPDLRYLDASGSGLTPAHLAGNIFLIHLSLSRCGLQSIHNLTFHNLRSLDLSDNKLCAIRVHQLRGLHNLQHLSLSKNPLKSMFPPETERLSFPALRRLDLSGVRMQKVHTDSFSFFPGLHALNLSLCAIDHVTGGGLHAVTELRILDITGCPMTRFPRDLISGLAELRFVRANNFKLCCPDVLPADFNLVNCKTHSYEISSCESLLRSDAYVLFLAAFSCLSLLGNLGCIVVRCYSFKSSTSGFSVFVFHLSISDFLMGVYLAIIGVADRVFKGTYLWDDLVWRYSMACKVAGFISLLSSEASAFLVCLISLDRCLVLHFPFRSLRFKARSAHVTCAVVWLVGLVMAAVPLTPMTSHWSFYSQTGICIPLPVNRGNFAGHHYSFGIFIICNFILFLFIAGGQVAIYISIQTNSLPVTDSTKKSTDLKIARRLMSVAVSDFLCWFPIGLVGVLASKGVPIPGELNVGMAILVLPLNSAINPFLYTINVLQERRRKSSELRILKQLTKSGQA